MKQFRVVALAIIAALSATAATPATRDWRSEMTARDSLSRVHPRMRARWLRERGLDDSPYTTFRKPDSGSGLRCIGRWPWGPSWELCGRDSLLFLGSGSGVRILSISDSIHPRQLGQIVARGLVSQLVVQDTLLFVACGNWGAQIYSVSDPANPRELGSMDAVTLDLCVRDTLCFTVGGDSLRIYNVADPLTPAPLSALADSNELVAVTGTYLYTSYYGTRLYDVSNPSVPVFVATQGGKCLAMFIRDTLLFRTATQSSYFSITDISDPPNPQPLGSVSGYGGIGLYADSQFAYLSCTYDHQGIFVIDIANPTSPQVRGGYDPEGSSNFDSYVPVLRTYGYLASDYGGLVVIDLHDANLPTESWSGFKAHDAVDIDVNQSLAVVANALSGTQLIDVSDPTAPSTVGLFDTVGVRFTYTASAADSFAFVGMSGISGRRYLRVLDVLDPSNPVLVAEESCRNPPEDMVLRDSFLYCAEVNQFQIFNVALPREPVLVGSCAIGDMNSCGLALSDSFAYVAGTLAGLQVINVARPSSPFLVSSNPDSRASAWGVAVRDTLVFVPSFYETLWVFSSANPESLRLLGGCSMGSGFHGYDVALSDDSLAFVATSQGIVLMDVSDPAAPRRLGACATPYDARRVVYEHPYIYAACYDAGVCVLETTAVGVSEQRPVETRTAVGMRGSVVRDELVIEMPAAGGGEVMLSAYDISGRCVEARVLRGQGQDVRYSFARLPAGVYVLRVRCSGQTQSFKVVKL